MKKLVVALSLLLLTPLAFAQAKDAGSASAVKDLQAQVELLKLENAKAQGAMEVLREQLRACQIEKASAPKGPTKAELCREAALRAVTAYESGSRAEFHRNFVEADSALAGIPPEDGARATLAAAMEPLSDAVALLHAYEVGRGGMAVAVPKDVYDRCVARYPEFKKRVKQMTPAIDGSYVARGVKEGADWLVPIARTRFSAPPSPAKE